MFAKNKRGGGSGHARPAQMIRPAADFMSDEALSEMINCEQCNEPLMKAFSSDHKCEPNALKANQAAKLVA